MLEKILEEIEQRISHYRDNATAEYVDVCAGLREAAGIIRKHMNDGWIPVEKRLPKDDNSVLMCSKTACIDVGWWTGKRWVTGFSHADVAKGIIAWRPLPDPYRPEKGTE